MLKELHHLKFRNILGLKLNQGAALKETLEYPSKIHRP
jgi:hypothetical protein